MSRSLFPLSKLLALALIVMAGAGCASPQQSMLAMVASSEPATAFAGREQIFVATTRARSEEPGIFFDGARADTLSFARAEITIPPVHEPGRLERPRRGAAIDPARHFAASGVERMAGEDEFAGTLRSRFEAADGRALVFVHGYNTRFDAAVFRAAQIVHDSGYRGTPILFTWASAGRTIDYVYDQNSASAARDGLEKTLRAIARAGARRIDIVAHSMGTWLTLEALRQLAIGGDRDISGRLGDVVLASPDIDIDVFKTQMRRYGQPDKPFYVLVSGDDRALELSSLIAGSRPRVGGYVGAGEAQLASLGVVVVDLSQISAGDSYNHMKFADNPVLVRMLGERLREDDSLGSSERDITDRVSSLVRGLGQTVTSAAEIIITTPVEVMRVAVGQ